VLSGVKSLYGELVRDEIARLNLMSLRFATFAGHSEAASGITSLLKAILAIRHASVSPVVHFSTPRTDVELPPHIKIASGGMTPLTPKDGKLRAGVNSFGAGGTNAHVVVESYGGEKDGKLGYPVWEYNLR
jgi:acyl transferase domain-containing protein